MSDIASMTNHAFFSDILYRAVMADTITNAECREACMRLWINYPPKANHEKHSISSCESADSLRASAENINEPALQEPIR